MPFPNEHACRLRDPRKCATFVRDNASIRITGNKKADRIFCKNQAGDISGIQSVRFPISKFTTKEAKSWCKDRGRFEKASKAKD